MERELWVNVLLQATLDVAGKGNGDQRAQLQQSTRAWFASNQKTPGSFLWVCDRLELNPEWIRRGLNKPISIDATRRDMRAEQRRRFEAGQWRWW
jgi:hypothetical protein